MLLASIFNFCTPNYQTHTHGVKENERVYALSLLKPPQHDPLEVHAGRREGKHDLGTIISLFQAT